MPRHANKHPCSLVTLLCAIVPASRKNHYKPPLYPRPTAIKSHCYQISPLSLSPYLYLIQAFRVNSPSQRLITSNYATVDLQPLVYLPSSHHAVGKQRLGRQCWTWMFTENRQTITRCSAVPSGFRLFFFRFCSNRPSAFGDSRFVDATAGNSAAGARNKPTTMSHRPRPF